MLVLSESPIGFALFSVTDEGKIGKDNLYKDFETPEGANNLCVQPTSLASEGALPPSKEAAQHGFVELTIILVVLTRFQPQAEGYPPILVDRRCRRGPHPAPGRQAL